MNPIPAAPAVTASAYVRQASWPAHQALEATALSQAWLRDGLTLSQYLSGLPVWFSAWQDLEQELAHLSVRVDGMDKLRPVARAQCLREDFSALAPDATWPQPHALGAPLDWSPAWQGLDPASRYLALCYVMTGSAMGNRVVAAHLHRHLGITASHGASFFAHTGVDSELTLGRFWTQWQSQFDSLLTNPSAWPTVAKAAVLVFEKLTERFQQWPH